MEQNQNQSNSNLQKSPSQNQFMSQSQFILSSNQKQSGNDYNNNFDQQNELNFIFSSNQKLYPFSICEEKHKILLSEKLFFIISYRVNQLKLSIRDDDSNSVRNYLTKIKHGQDLNQANELHSSTIMNNASLFNSIEHLFKFIIKCLEHKVMRVESGRLMVSLENTRKYLNNAVTEDFYLQLQKISEKPSNSTSSNKSSLESDKDQKTLQCQLSQIIMAETELQKEHKLMQMSLQGMEQNVDIYNYFQIRIGQNIENYLDDMLIKARLIEQLNENLSIIKNGSYGQWIPESTDLNKFIISADYTQIRSQKQMWCGVLGSPMPNDRNCVHFDIEIITSKRSSAIIGIALLFLKCLLEKKTNLYKQKGTQFLYFNTEVNDKKPQHVQAKNHSYVDGQYKYNLSPEAESIVLKAKDVVRVQVDYLHNKVMWFYNKSPVPIKQVYFQNFDLRSAIIYPAFDTYCSRIIVQLGI